ncbi:MAG: hypothetical protein VX109_02395 [Planctomycetota bacterium]|nr:hypothetical protein [Planctomycetota bacterium]
MPLTSIVACQIFAIADVPGRREELPPPPLSQAFVSLIFDGGFMNNTDVGQFGNLSKRTAGLEVLAEGRLTRNLHWDLRLEQRFDEYDFTSTDVLDPIDDGDPTDRPWRNVYTTTFALEFSRKQGATTTFGGVGMQAARQRSLNYGDGRAFSGHWGMTTRYSDDLAFGWGLSIREQIDGPTQYIPVLALDWSLTNDLSVEGWFGPWEIREPRLDIVWEAFSEWDLFAGFGYRRDRFRLDDFSGFDDDGDGDTDLGTSEGWYQGVGQDSAFPIWVGARYVPNLYQSFEVRVGRDIQGELQLRDREGSSLLNSDYDGALAVSLRWQLRY